MKIVLFVFALLATVPASADELKVTPDATLFHQQSMFIVTDTVTGCEYIAVSAGGGEVAPLTPRMDANGHQVCKK